MKKNETHGPNQIHSIFMHRDGQVAIYYLTIGLFAILAMLLIFRGLRFLDFAYASLIYPFEIAYSEGIIWQQLLLMFGPDWYGSIENYPYTVFHYPPFYHITVRVLMILGLDPLVAGRIVSLIGFSVIGLAAGAITFLGLKGRVSRISIACGVCTTLIVLLTCEPVVTTSRLMRIDTLAVALNLVGVSILILSLSRPRIRYLVIFFFILAVFTKQTAISIPIASLLTLLWFNWKSAAKLIFVGTVVGSSVAAYLQIISHGGFLRHIVLYNINEFTFSWYCHLLWVMRYHAIYLLMASITIGFIWLLPNQKITKSTAVTLPVNQTTLTHDHFLRIYLTLLFISSHAATITAGKTGANINYFIESICMWAIIIGIGSGYIGQTIIARSRFWRWTIGWPALLIVQVLLLPLFGPNISGYMLIDDNRIRALHRLVERIKIEDKPVLSHDVVLLLRAGRRMPWETMIFTELAAQGLWDEGPAVKMIEEQKFAFIITGDILESQLSVTHFSPRMRAAIEAAYPTRMMFAGHILLLPKTSSP